MEHTTPKSNATGEKAAEETGMQEENDEEIQVDSTLIYSELTSTIMDMKMSIRASLAGNRNYQEKLRKDIGQAYNLVERCRSQMKSESKQRELKAKFTTNKKNLKVSCTLNHDKKLSTASSLQDCISAAAKKVMQTHIRSMQEKTGEFFPRMKHAKRQQTVLKIPSLRNRTHRTNLSNQPQLLKKKKKKEQKAKLMKNVETVPLKIPKLTEHLVQSINQYVSLADRPKDTVFPEKLEEISALTSQVTDRGHPHAASSTERLQPVKVARLRETKAFQTRDDLMLLDSLSE